MLHIKKCTESEVHQQLGNKDWRLSLSELGAFIAILYIQGAIGAKGLDLYSLLCREEGMLPKAKKLDRVIRFLRFDEEIRRST